MKLIVILLLCVVSCLAGIQETLSNGTLTGCPDGYGLDKDNPYKVGCQICPPGFYQGPKNTGFYCKMCGWPYTSGASGAVLPSDCTKCVKGYRRDADSGDCVPCPKGTYSDMFDAASCTSCPEGHSTADIYGSDSPSGCVDIQCEPGYGYRFRKSGSRCEKCPVGRYSPDGKTEGCILCPWLQGYTNIEEGLTSCTGCRLGWMRDGDKCVKCPEGTYRRSAYDPQVCTPCPEGESTHGAGSYQCVPLRDKITCPEGETWQEIPEGFDCA